MISYTQVIGMKSIILLTIIDNLSLLINPENIYIFLIFKMYLLKHFIQGEWFLKTLKPRQNLF